MAQVWNLPLVANTAAGSSLGMITINDGFEALRTLHSGATEPTSTVAYMLWADLTLFLLKMRNSTNTGWITLGKIADAETNFGAVRKDGDNNVMTGTIKMRAQKILMDTDDDCWLQSPSANQVDIATNSVVRFSITDTQIDFQGLELKDPQNDGTDPTGGAVFGRMFVDIGGAQKYVTLRSP
jgi:hypothetical protein